MATNHETPWKKCFVLPGETDGYLETPKNGLTMWFPSVHKQQNYPLHFTISLLAMFSKQLYLIHSYTNPFGRWCLPLPLLLRNMFVDWETYTNHKHHLNPLGNIIFSYFSWLVKGNREAYGTHVCPTVDQLLMLGIRSSHA